MIDKLKNIYKNSAIFKIIEKSINNSYRKRLTNKNFTILCTTCVGGILYHRFNQPFNSPTINLGIKNKEFCSFLEYLDYYLEQDVHDNGNDKDNNPKGIIYGNGKDIPDIVIYFVHYANFEDGKEKWDKRKSRIDRNNTYVIMIDTGDLTRDDLKKVENFKCNNKVIFTPNKKPLVDWAVYVNAKKCTGYLHEYYLLRNALGITRLEKKFDFVSFLNKK